MEYRQTFLVFLCLIVGCFSHVIKRQAWYTGDDICRTPDRKTGFCIPRHECKSMVQFLEQKKKLDEREQKALKSYSCGSRDIDQTVCCPKEKFSLDWLEGDCRTPDNSIGRCVPVSSCQPMLDFIKNNKNIGSAAQVALRQYLCSSVTSGSSDYKVCCPSKPIILQTRYTDDNSHMMDHTSHKNAHLLPKDCGNTGSEGKIVGGVEAALFEFPWAAALKYKIGDTIQFNCGGSLINNHYLITAAHCIQPTLIGVRLGELNFTTNIDCGIDEGGVETCAPPPQEFTISPTDVVVHPQYNSEAHDNDIALIRLEKEANTSIDSVGPICLPLTKNQKQIRDKLYTVIGWGTTATARRSKALLKTKVKAQDNSKCESDRSMHTRILCAGGVNEKDACTGDSGGPLTLEYGDGGKVRTLQFGIVSYGPSVCGKENTPATYTSVPAHVEWILDNLKP